MAKKAMKALTQRLIRGWSVTRVLFALLGACIVADAVMSTNRFALLPGVYFLVMGLLGFGCAGGNCAVPTQNKKS
jgi:hypothetical protein